MKMHKLVSVLFCHNWFNVSWNQLWFSSMCIYIYPCKKFRIIFLQRYPKFFMLRSTLGAMLLL